MDYAAEREFVNTDNKAARRPKTDVPKRVNAKPAHRDKRKLVGVGSDSSSGLKSAVEVYKKFVFHVDNVTLGVIKEDIVRFLKDNGIETVTRFTAKSWMHKDELDNVSAFRVCVKYEEKAAVLDTNLWPKRVMIREWRFKGSRDGGSIS